MSECCGGRSATPRGVLRRRRRFRLGSSTCASNLGDLIVPATNRRGAGPTEPSPDPPASGLTFSAGATMRARIFRIYAFADHMVRHSLVLLLLAAPVTAQQPRQLTAQDYARAERLLGANAAP